MTDSYDAILVVSFGGPEGPEQVIPFLENVLRGKNVPRQRMRQVAEHYQQFGGVSPLNEQNRALIRALHEELQQHGPRLPIYWGNRNWHPLLPDTMRQMKADGVQNALAFFTSAYSSYSSCRQYLENVADAQRAAGAGAPQVAKLRAFFNHPGFIEAMADRVSDALRSLPVQGEAVQLVYTAHSIPLTMARGCAYEQQLDETSRLVSQRLGHANWKLVYQSRSGPPSQPWLEPDVCEYLEGLPSRSGERHVVIVPIGFISDHIEVQYDLDTEARDVCRQVGIEMVRARTVGTHPRFIQMIRELIEERILNLPLRTTCGRLPAVADVCPAECCPAATE